MADIKTKIRKKQARSYLNKDFDGFKNDLLLYARTFFSDKIQDFSEPSMGGLLLDMAAYVGDVMSYYLDYQLGELNIETAIEQKNIEKLLRTAGVKVTGAAPSTVSVDFYIKVAPGGSGGSDSNYPNENLLPIIRQGTTVTSNSGVSFELIDDIDFALGDYVKREVTKDIIDSTTGTTTGESAIDYYILSKSGICRSGAISVETFNISNSFIPFRTISLGSSDVATVISVFDSEGNRYYEVESLSQDVVYKRVLNASSDQVEVPENLELIPAPFRFTTITSRQTGLTTLRFGSGRAETLDDDIIPDPSELALPLYEKKTFSSFSIDPNNLLRTSTLGISPVNTAITVRYRHGGGLSHNVAADSIRSVSILDMKFPNSASMADIHVIKASIDVINPKGAQGGENQPTINELRSIALAAKFSQSRIVTKEDLIARVYTMPSQFGRVFRIGVRANPSNPLSTNMYIISRDSSGALVESADSLKDNLREFLSQQRLVADAIDILSVSVINIGIKYNVVIDAISNKQIVLQNVNVKLKDYMQVKNFQVDQPLITTDLRNLIINTAGVVALADFDLFSRFGDIAGRAYSTLLFDPSLSGPNVNRGILYGPDGSIFEVKFPDNDIIGSAL
jgi:hypothetical protein